MKIKTESYKGTRDFYPKDMLEQNYIFDVWRKSVQKFGYQEYSTPLIEPTKLYSLKTSQEIVNEQIYSFLDRGGRDVALRPELTPSVARLVAAKHQELGYPLRLFSIPDIWRYERPQRGRLRQHWQLNVDIFGSSDLWADYEVISIADYIMQSFKAKRNMYKIFINSRELLNYLLHEVVGINRDLGKEVTSIIDKIDKINETLFLENLTKKIGEEKAFHLDGLLKVSNNELLPSEIKNHESFRKLSKIIKLLNENGIDNVSFKMSMVRGFDYYSDLVFEMFDTNPENSRALFGGGRYDNLMDIFNIDKIPTVGFGMGDVAIKDFLVTHNLLPKFVSTNTIFLLTLGEVKDSTIKFIDLIRSKDLNFAVDFTNKKIDKKIRNSIKLGAKYIIFIGDDEVINEYATIKNLENGLINKININDLSLNNFQ